MGRRNGIRRSLGKAKERYRETSRNSSACRRPARTQSESGCSRDWNSSRIPSGQGPRSSRYRARTERYAAFRRLLHLRRRVWKSSRDVRRSRPSGKGSSAFNAGGSARPTGRSRSGRSLLGDGRSQSAPHCGLPPIEAARCSTACTLYRRAHHARSVARTAQSRRSQGIADRYQSGRPGQRRSVERNAAEAFDRSSEAQNYRLRRRCRQRK